MEKILIIEDDELIRENLLELFRNEGYTVETANNGKIGVEKAKYLFPSLIISDIMMPEMDGFQVYGNLRADPQLSTIPFIFLSALADKANIRSGMNLGAEDYLTKPFENSELLDVAKRRIEKSKLVKKSMDDLKLSLSLSVPHELITPLNAVMGFSQLLIDGNKEDKGISRQEIQEFSQYIYDAGKSLLHLIQNYVLFIELSFMKEDATYREKARSEVCENIDKIFPDVILELAKIHNREKDLDISFENANLMISSKNLEKIIEELLDNAIKFSTANSKIKIKGVCEGAFYHLSIQDNGKGMSIKELNMIDSFVQFERNKIEQSGLGLGLSLVMKMLEVNQGKLTIMSEKKKGTTLIVRIPLVPITM